MKKYGTWILVGIIVLLAVVLSGVLIYLYNQPPQQRAVVPPVVEIKPMEPDSSLWGQNFPNQWETLQKTETNNIDTTYGGSSKFSHLERDPRQVILFAGYPVQQGIQRRPRPHERRGGCQRPSNASTKHPPPPAIPANPPTTRLCGSRWAWKPMMPCCSAT